MKSKRCLSFICIKAHYMWEVFSNQLCIFALLSNMLILQALQFDPTLKAEIQFDLKQFERAKKEKLAGNKIHQLLVSKLCLFT
jgi:hypothetical protein